MRQLSYLAVPALLMLALLAADVQAESGRIYGVLYTVDSDVFEGWIRWDKNEAFWDDVLDGTCDKERTERTSSRKARRYKDRSSKSINIFGLRIGESDWNVNYLSGSSCELQFGYINTLYIEGSSEAIAELKGGHEVVFTSGGDIGSSVREILLVDINEGEIYFDWNDIEKIEFKTETREPDDGRQRLYGTVSTRPGGDFTGWVEWDVDEVFSDDIIDGDEDRRRKRKIKLDRIQTIERRSSSSATLILKEGKEMTMRNSNDVDSDNRGIYVKSSDWGRIKVDWSDFEKVEFMDVPAGELPRFGDYDGSVPIKGTVTTEDGDTFSGRIIWDNDEEHTWEHLNGEFKGMEMDIPFAAIAMIEKSSRNGSIVTLKNGDSYLLKGSNDVDDDNRGIFVVDDDGDMEEIDWYDFEKLVID